MILGLISNDDHVNTYVQETNHFVDWCDMNFLNLNVKKTKEMFIDYSKSPCNFAPVNIKGENVEVVQEYKYLGNIIDHKLKGDLNVSQIHKKCNQRLYFLRKLKNVKVDCTILTLFYKSIIQSVLSFCISSWFGSCVESDKAKLCKIIKCARKLGCVDLQELSELYEDAVRSKLDKILLNAEHPLHNCFKMLPSGSRMDVPFCRTNRLKNAFVAKAVKFYNT